MRNKIASILLALVAAMVATIAAVPCANAQADRLQPADYQKLRAVGQVKFSPDGKLLAYTITRYDRPGRPWGQVWVMDLAPRNRFAWAAKMKVRAARCGRLTESGSPTWATAEGKHGLGDCASGWNWRYISRRRSCGTNAPLPSQGNERHLVA